MDLVDLGHAIFRIPQTLPVRCEWAFVAPYLMLMAPNAPQAQVRPARGLQRAALDSTHRCSCPTSFHRGRPCTCSRSGVRDDGGRYSRTLQSTPESGHFAGYDGYKGRKGRKGHKVHAAVDTLGELLALRVTAADTQNRAQVADLTEWVVERDFAWASRFRRLVRDYERLPEAVAGLHFVAFACLMLHRLITLVAQSP